VYAPSSENRGENTMFEIQKPLSSSQYQSQMTMAKSAVNPRAGCKIRLWNT
jgi:hypothetical protein